MNQPNDQQADQQASTPPPLVTNEFVKHMTVSDDHAGMRLDVYLSKVMQLSRQHAKRLIQQNLVYLNGQVMSRSAKGMQLHAGSQVTLKAYDVVEANDTLAVPVLYQGDGFVIVDKPAGMPVHPLNMSQNKTVLNGLIGTYPQLQDVGEGGLKSGVVHRLDVQTSGALLVATQQQAWENLRDLFETRTLKKTYRALVYGQLRGQKHQTAYLRITQHQPAKVRVDNELLHNQARQCELQWKAVETFKQATLLEIDLQTGFLHQIRAMLAHLGHPIVGDTFYGPSDAHRHTPRQMLHAARLEFDDIDITSPDPQDFASHLKQFRS